LGLERVERSKPKKTRVPDERNLFARGMDARISQVHARCGCGCETVSGLAGCARSGFAQSTSLQGGNGSLLMPEILVFRFKKPSLFLKKNFGDLFRFTRRKLQLLCRIDGRVRVHDFRGGMNLRRSSRQYTKAHWHLGLEFSDSNSDFSFFLLDCSGRLPIALF